MSAFFDIKYKGKVELLKKVSAKYYKLNISMAEEGKLRL